MSQYLLFNPRQWMEKNGEWRSPLLYAAIFFAVTLLILLHRHFVFYSSYDQGLFTQVFWNNLHGNWFQSSLTSGLSVAVTQDAQVPKVTFIHLGHHFVINFLLWLPLFALFPSPVTLLALQVTLMTAGGLVLYVLARRFLEPNLSRMITASYFCAIAVIGSTLANFYEHCQIPLFTFAMLLALEKRQWVWFWVMLALVLGSREESGFVTFGIGLYFLLARCRWRVGLALCGLSFAYVAIVTAVIVPSFSDDSSRLYLVGRFEEFVPGNPNPSTLQVLWGMITHPIGVIQRILVPVDQRLIYLVAQTLPLAFVPLVSSASWAMVAVPLLSLVLQDNSSALNYLVRYALAVVPGMFYGAILWWSQRSRPVKFFTPKFERIWKGCLVVSVVWAIVANPNQSLSFLFPDSLSPWVHVPITRQWQRVATLQSILRVIPPDASVSASTHLIPHLATRRTLTRVPFIQVRDAQGLVKTVDYIVADLWRLNMYARAFRTERNRLEEVVPLCDRLLADSSYGLLQFDDGVVLLQKGVPSNAIALAAWQEQKAEFVKERG
jgi:uncharacterized membrane protein